MHTFHLRLISFWPLSNRKPLRLPYQMAKACLFTNTQPLSPDRSRNSEICRQVRELRDGCVQEAWKEMLGRLPSLPMKHHNFWWEIKKGNWETMMISHKEGTNKHSEANSCRTMGTVRGYFCLVSAINWTCWKLTVYSAFSHSSLTKSGKFPFQKRLIFFPA